MKAYSIKKQHTMTQTSDCDASMHLNIDMTHMRDVDTDMHIAIHDAGIGLVRRYAIKTASKLPARSVMTETATTTTGATAPASLKRATPARPQTAHYPSAGPCAGTGMHIFVYRSNLVVGFLAGVCACARAMMESMRLRTALLPQKECESEREKLKNGRRRESE